MFCQNFTCSMNMKSKTFCAILTLLYGFVGLACFEFHIGNQRRRQASLERFENTCGGRNVPIIFKYTSMRSEDTKLQMNSTITVKRDVLEDISMVIGIERCKNKENLDTCEHFYDHRTDKFCTIVVSDSQLWSPLFSVYEPNFKCPLKKVAPIQMDRSYNSVDEESMHGRFGWITLEEHHIPYIIREGENYCALHMAEETVLARYDPFLCLSDDCINIPSYRITEAERRLLNEINSFHCDYQFGYDAFSQRDLIIRLDDLVEFCKFLDACYKTFYNLNELSGTCGFVIIDDISVVPYVMYKEEKYFPLFYFEGAEHLQVDAKILKGWHLSYLKFCFTFQGIRDEYTQQETCAAISMNVVKQSFPPNTDFKDFWPRDRYRYLMYQTGKDNTSIWCGRRVFPFFCDELL